MKRSFGVLGGLILSVMAMHVQAVPNTVNLWHTASNGSATWPSDSHSGLELSAFHKSGWGNTTTESDTGIQAYGFSDLHGVSYTSSLIGDIDHMPLAGNTDGQFIQFDSSSASQHAMDNIRLEVGNLLNFTAVPVPTVAWLFAPGMLGLVAVARRHQS